MSRARDIDAEAIAFARRLLAREPRADYTITELPVGNNVQSTDVLPAARNGGVVQVAASTFAGLVSNVALTLNLVTFPTSLTLASPSFTTSSAGSRLILYPDVGSTQADFAIGMANNTMWFTVPTASTSYNFEFYGGTTPAATIDGQGNLTAAGSLSTAGGVTATGAVIGATATFGSATINSSFVKFTNTGSLAAPTFTTSSAGTRLLLFPEVTGSTVDFALGMATSQMWLSLPNSSGTYTFAIYGGTTQVASIDSAGNLIGTSITLNNGVTGGVQYATGAGAYSGNGAPSFAAHKGSIYLRGDGATGTSFYVNYGGTSGSWTAVA